MIEERTIQDTKSLLKYYLKRMLATVYPQLDEKRALKRYEELEDYRVNYITDFRSESARRSDIYESNELDNRTILRILKLARHIMQKEKYCAIRCNPEIWKLDIIVKDDDLRYYKLSFKVTETDSFMVKVSTASLRGAQTENDQRKGTKANFHLRKEE